MSQPKDRDPPTEDERRGMAWWNRMHPLQRRRAMNEAYDELGHAPSVAETWEIHKRSGGAP